MLTSTLCTGYRNGRLDCGFLSAVEKDPLEFQALFQDEMLVIMDREHPLAKSNSLPLQELRKHPLIAQFKGADHDVQQIFRRAKIHPQTKYILNDDISVMGMVAHGDGIALMPRLMLQTASFDLAALPLEPRQYRTIGLATPPMKESTLLVRTFGSFCQHASLFPG